MNLQLERIRVLTDELKLPGIETSVTALTHHRLMGPEKLPKPKKVTQKERIPLIIWQF